MTTSQLLTSAWNWNPWVILVCAVMLWPGMWGRADLGLRTLWLCLGAVVFFITLDSPIDVLADGYLFSAHMLQHLLLLLIVPLLVLLGLPETAAMTNGGRGGGSTPGGALACWLLGGGGMWLWHAPALCNAAVANVWVHRLQYVSLLGMGLAFWWPIIGPASRARITPLAGMIYLFTACLGCTVLGIIITFSPVEVCSIYLNPVDRLGIMPLLQDQWGLTPEKDQQLGGLLMWVPACLIYFFGILGLLARWYREPGREAVIAVAAQGRLMEKSHGL